MGTMPLSTSRAMPGSPDWNDVPVRHSGSRKVIGLDRVIVSAVVTAA
jgi:hypothetical protein